MRTLQYEVFWLVLICTQLEFLDSGGLAQRCHRFLGVFCGILELSGLVATLLLLGACHLVRWFLFSPVGSGRYFLSRFTDWPCEIGLDSWWDQYEQSCLAWEDRSILCPASVVWAWKSSIFRNLRAFGSHPVRRKRWRAAEKLAHAQYQPWFHIPLQEWFRCTIHDSQSHARIYAQNLTKGPSASIRMQSASRHPVSTSAYVHLNSRLRCIIQRITSRKHDALYLDFVYLVHL